MTPGRANFRIYQGSTFNQIFRWESKTIEYATIEDIAKSAPCIITVAAGHFLRHRGELELQDLVALAQPA